VTTRRRPTIPRLAFGRARGEGGEESAADRFRRVILPHLNAAYCYARYLTRADAAAEDVVQEAFLRAFRSLESCRDSEKAWLLTIVRNCHHDLARTNSRYHTGNETDIEAVDDLTHYTEAERTSDIHHLRRTVEALPEPFREAVVLRELEGLSYREIADMSAVPMGTVMSRLARGRQMLTAMLLRSDAAADRGAIGL
jgi:RNA polymerase sigma-70 factor (ECF subfamily)